MGRFVFVLSAVLLSATAAAAQSFVDNFDRPDAADLGPNWQVVGTGSATRTIGNQAGNVVGANNLSLVTTANYSAAYTDTKVSADVFHIGPAGTGYAALAFGHNGSTAAGQGLFIKVQDNTTSGTFNSVGFYTGVGSGTTTFWTDPPVFFTAGVTPFTSARLSVWASDASTINLGVDSNFDGVDDQTYTRHLNVATMTFGTQVGVGVFGTNTRVDNFSAAPLVPVPEPAALLAVACAAAGARRLKRYIA